MVALVAVNEAILPVPLAARPTDGVLLVQLNTTPAGVPEKVTGAVGDPLHNTWLATAFTTGVGLTSTVAVVVGPTQLLAVGVMVKVTVIGLAVVLVSVPLIGVPAPLAAIPVTVATLSLVQVKVVLAALLVSTIGIIAVASQIVCDAGVAIAFGVGLTVIVKLCVGPAQAGPPPALV